MSTAVSLSPFQELRYLIRWPGRESLSHPSVLSHSLLPVRIGGGAANHGFLADDHGFGARVGLSF